MLIWAARALSGAERWAPVAGVLLILATPAVGKPAMPAPPRGGGWTFAAGRPVVLELESPREPDKKEEVRGEIWQLGEADIARLETRVHLPPGVEPIESYARYYLGVAVNGRHLVLAYYARAYFHRRGIYLNELGPDDINDGGCSVIHFVFEVEDASTRYLWCNGNA